MPLPAEESSAIEKGRGGLEAQFTCSCKPVDRLTWLSFWALSWFDLPGGLPCCWVRWDCYVMLQRISPPIPTIFWNSLRSTLTSTRERRHVLGNLATYHGCWSPWDIPIDIVFLKTDNGNALSLFLSFRGSVGGLSHFFLRVISVTIREEILFCREKELMIMLDGAGDAGQEFMDFGVLKAYKMESSILMDTGSEF